MNKATMLPVIATLLTLVSGAANAKWFDGNRQSVQMGIGIGVHISELVYKDSFSPTTTDTDPSTAYSITLGYGFTNRIVGYIGGKSGSYSIDGSSATIAIGGLGVSFYLTEVSPSLYLTGLIGGASMSVDEENNDLSAKGNGWLVGVGYEVTERLHLELSHARGKLRDQQIITIGSREIEPTSTLNSSFLTLRYLVY